MCMERASGQGRLFAGRYRRIGRLGTGGMASVYLAKDEHLGREVAVKRLHSAAPDDLLRRFQREAQLGAALNHPNIVAIFDSVSDEDSVYIVMEYVKGESLDARIARGQIEPELALGILEQTAAALDYAHERDIVHRDIKPSNLLVREDGVVKVADLGIATATDMSQITASGSVMGTLPYIAPERLRGRPDGPACDIYSLAAVAFEMLAGRKAIQPTTPDEAVRLATDQSAPDLRDAWPAAPAQAAEIICSAMAAEPADRPRSATGLVEELEEALGQTGSSKAELAAATLALPVVPDPVTEAAAQADEAPTTRQEIVEPPLPPPPPRPQPSSRPLRRPPPAAAPRRQPAPPPPQQQPQRSGRGLSGSGIAAILACLAVLGAIVFAVASSGGDDEGSSSDGRQAAAAGPDGGQDAGDGNEGAGSGESGGGTGGDTATETAETPSEPDETETGAGGTPAAPEAGTAPEIDPDYGAQLDAQGYELLQAGDPAAALPYFEEALTYFPPGDTSTNYSYVIFNLGTALTQLGRGEEAIPYLEERLERFDDRDDEVQAVLDEAYAQAAE